MKTYFIDGPALAKRLRQLAKRCDGLDVAMAYVKLGGLNPLLHAADGLITGGDSVRIVFGLAEGLGITDWRAADRLLKLSKLHTNVRVKKWNNAGFHPKLLISYGTPTYLVVGSANLTAAAQSCNAEANLVVENPSSALINDARSFFEFYFTNAPPLKPADVETYKKKVKQIALAKGPAKPQDSLPPSPSKTPLLGKLLAGARVWKIAPGKDAKLWPEWAREIGDDDVGVVAMGWNEVGNLDQFREYDDLKSKVAATAEKVWNKEWNTKTNVGYVTDQLWDFRRNIRKGDRIIVYSEQRVLGVAEVLAGPQYRFSPPNSIAFAHQITVRYLWHRQWPAPADAYVKATLGKQGTLMLVEEPGFWQHLVSKLG